MLKTFSVTALSALAAFAIGFVSQPTAQATAPFNKLTSANGQEMFSSLCTSCHGVDGKGHGHILTEHNAPPIDLTILSKNNHGKFPEAHVIHVLEYGAEVPSHTSIEMPVWGPKLGKINQKDPNDKEFRIHSLSHYLETIQVK
jgi:hypothetical protein